MVRRIPPIVDCIFGNSHYIPLRFKGKLSGGLIRNSYQTRPWDMTFINQMVSYQPGLIPKFNGNPTHARFCSATIFVNHYFNYFYYHLTKGNLAEENSPEQGSLRSPGSHP